jgi:cell shape-determining protein MreD
MFHVKRRRILCHTSASVVASINRLSPILAIAVGVLHAGLAPVLLVAGVKPNIALVASVLVAASLGFAPGVTWAFLAGLTANLLSGEPLGSIPLSLLAASALASSAAPLLGRLPLAYPVVAVFFGSIVADGITILVSQLLAGGDWPGLPLQIVVAAAAVNAALAALVIIPIRLLQRRRERAEPAVVRRWPS